MEKVPALFAPLSTLCCGATRRFRPFGSVTRPAVHGARRLWCCADEVGIPQRREPAQADLRPLARAASAAHAPDTGSRLPRVDQHRPSAQLRRLLTPDPDFTGRL